jgi:hypothetical protein
VKAGTSTIEERAMRYSGEHQAGTPKLANGIVNMGDSGPPGSMEPLVSYRNSDASRGGTMKMPEGISSCIPESGANYGDCQNHNIRR